MYEPVSVSDQLLGAACSDYQRKEAGDECEFDQNAGAFMRACVIEKFTPKIRFFYVSPSNTSP
jgi:hypothetical protein